MQTYQLSDSIPVVLQPVPALTKADLLRNAEQHQREHTLIRELTELCNPSS